MDHKAIDISRTAGHQLHTRGWRLATAESCTGGLIGHSITEIGGSSRYYQGGIVAYDNAVKQQILGVSPQILSTVGAVSAECAREMAQGVRRMFGVEVGIATTGIAGPEGGTPDKPVGLVYIAIATPGGTRIERFNFSGDRGENKVQAAHAALTLLVETLQQPPTDAPLL